MNVGPTHEGKQGGGGGMDAQLHSPPTKTSILPHPTRADLFACAPAMYPPTSETKSCVYTPLVSPPTVNQKSKQKTATRTNVPRRGPVESSPDRECRLPRGLAAPSGPNPRAHRSAIVAIHIYTVQHNPQPLDIT